MGGDRPANPSVTDPNPFHVLDDARFAGDAVASFQEEQVAILRRLSPYRWVTHNVVMHVGEFDHYRAAECPDFATWDSYPLVQVERFVPSEPEKPRRARASHPHLIPFNHDPYRGLLAGEKRGVRVMEQGAGQVNRGALEPAPSAPTSSPPFGGAPPPALRS